AAHTRSHSPRTFVTPRKVRRRKPIACLIAACRRKTCRTRAGRIAQRGGGGAVAAPMRRRGRRPIEAPGSAAPNRSGDGAPASPHRRSRVTLLTDRAAAGGSLLIVGGKHRLQIRRAFQGLIRILRPPGVRKVQ